MKPNMLMRRFRNTAYWINRTFAKDIRAETRRRGACLYREYSAPYTTVWEKDCCWERGGHLEVSFRIENNPPNRTPQSQLCSATSDGPHRRWARQAKLLILLSGDHIEQSMKSFPHLSGEEAPIITLLPGGAEHIVKARKVFHQFKDEEVSIITPISAGFHPLIELPCVSSEHFYYEKRTYYVIVILHANDYSQTRSGLMILNRLAGHDDVYFQCYGVSQDGEVDPIN